MLLCKVLLLLGLAQFLGVAVSAFRLTKSKDVVKVNVRQNASLQWTYEVDAGESYSIVWGTSQDGVNVQHKLYTRIKGKTAKRSPQMPTKFVDRVKIIKQATLFIQRVDLSDEGYYMCQISGEFLTNREPIRLEVIDPPRILPLLPQTEEWTEGEKRELACHTAGRPKPKVTWKKGDQILKQERKVAVTKLDFPSVTWRDAGSYVCLAENAGGRSQKQVEITVLYAPKDTSIKTDAPQDTVSDGSYITITCKAHGNPPPEYKFYIEGQSINDRGAQRSGELRLTTVGFSQSGIYSCEPENDMGTGPRKDITVYVRHSPQIVLRPENQKVDENGQVSARCEAEGFPPPIIKWVKLLGNKLVRNGTSSLFIQNVQRSDHGWYRCIATNGFGDNAIAEFEINVYYAPRINRTASSQNVPAWSGSTANLSCVADGNPAPRYTWTNSSGTVATSEVSGLLRVTPQGADGFGPYTCTVENDKGTDSLAISLVKVDRPVVELKFQGSSDDSISLTWSLLSDEKSNVFLQHYILQYRTTHSNSWIKTVPRIPPQATSYRLRGLKPYTEYEVRLYARNQHFTSDPSTVVAKTTEATPSPLQNVQVYPINGTAIHVKWDPPQYPNGPLELYNVLYSESDSYLGDDLMMMIVTVMPNVTEAFIGGLTPFTNYTIKVKVKNTVAFGSSKPLYILTETAAPSKPLDNEANSTGPHSVRLKWKKPKDLNGVVVVFKIRMLWRFKNVKGEYSRTERIVHAKVTRRARKRRSANGRPDYTVLQLEPEREIELRNLQPFAIISIRVAEGTRDAQNRVLWGPFSNNQTVETEEGAPSAPRNVAVTDKKPTSVKVTWLPPEFPNGIITKYRFLYSNNTGKNYTVEVTKGLKNASLFYVITGLKKDTDYLIYVQAFTSNYPGKVSSPVSRIETTKTPADVAGRSSVDNSSLYGGVFAGIIVLAFVIIIVVLVIRKHRRRHDSTELDGKRYAVANSNDSGIGDKESLDRVPGVKYLQGVRRGSEGSESWV